MPLTHLWTPVGRSEPCCEYEGTTLERGHHPFGHRRRHELVRIRNAFMRRSDDVLSHLRFGRGRT